LVSVIVVARNEHNHLESLLPELLRQTGKIPGAELIVVDNASTDETESLLRGYQNSSKHFRLVLMPRNNMGLARATGALRANNTLLAYLDADCFPASDWLERGTKLFHEHQGLNSLLFAMGGSGLPNPSKSDHHLALHQMLSKKWGNGGLGHGISSLRMKEVFHLPTCNLFIDRAKLLEMGNFSARFARVGEDLELSFRARKQGWKTIFAPDLSVIHDQSPALGSWARRMLGYGAGQARIALEHPEHWRSKKGAAFLALPPAAFYLGPALIVIYLFFLGFVAQRSLAAGGKWACAVHLLFLVLATHIFYYAGLWLGAFELLVRETQKKSHEM
jgi:GT2 family glycosyltransferase